MTTGNEAKGKARGGNARAESLSPARRKEIAMLAVQAKRAKGELIKAEYEGKLKIGDTELDVAVLENKQRIITLTAVFKALDRPIRGNARLINMPTFMDAKNLQPFIGEDLRAVINKVKYISLTGKIQEGYDALIIPLVSDLYLKVRSENKLLVSQEATAKKAEILVRTLAKVGIVALVDEATGYQRERARDDLAKILEAFVAKELQPYVKTFPSDYYEQLFRLYSLPYPPIGNRSWRPSFFGTITNDVIYARLAPDILPELKKAASKAEKRSKLHQWLTNDIGHPKLREHLASIVTILKLSKDPKEFKENVDCVHARYGSTMQIPFDLPDD